MDIKIREMKPEEAALVRQIGRGSFDIVDAMFMPKPKNALLAIKGEEIVGSTSYKIFSAKNNQKIGYVETAYVKKGCEGQGIGNILYKEITEFLKKQGCSTVTATVKDDNVASWRLFEKNEYSVLSFSKMWNEYGLIGSLRLGFDGLLLIATGYHMWSTVKTEKSSQWIQFCLFVLINLIVFLPRILLCVSLSDFLIQMAAVLVLLVIPILAGRMVTLLYKEKWEFCVARCGVLISLMVCALGGVFPIVGRSYPVQYNRTDKLKCQMAMEALTEWMTALLLVLAGVWLKDVSRMLDFFRIFGTGLLFFRAIPIYPFECFGGRRIWDYNKALSVLVLISSFILLIVF